MGNNNAPAFRLLLLVFSLLIHGTRSYVLQEIPQAVTPSLSKRASFLGGWGVYTPGACPDQTAECPFHQYCCPSNTVCSIDSLGGAAVCCPDQHNCASYALAVPACANTSWSMYTYSGDTRFCCQPGQVGLIGGVCVGREVAIASTALASSAVQITGTVAVSSAAATSPGGGYSAATTSVVGGNSAATTSVGGANSAAATGTATEGILTPTTTKSSSASASAGDSGSSSSSPAPNGLSGGAIGGIVGGVVGGVVIIALLVYFAFSCGRNRSAKENYTSNHYTAPAMVEEAKMAPPMSSNQSAYPQKYDGYGAKVVPVPTGYKASAPNASATFAEVGDNKAHAYNRAELGSF